MVGDIPMDLINEVMSTIADPAAIAEVSSYSQLFTGMNKKAGDFFVTVMRIKSDRYFSDQSAVSSLCA